MRQYTCNLFVFESLAQLLVVAFPNPILGMLAFLMYWTTSIVFCGLVFRGGDVIWPFRALYYVMPLRWLFNGLGYDLYTPSAYDGAEECVPGELVTTDQGAATCAATGFYCTDASQSLGCYGRTGSQARHRRAPPLSPRPPPPPPWTARPCSHPSTLATHAACPPLGRRCSTRCTLPTSRSTLPTTAS